MIEGGPRVLPAYAEDLSRSAQEQLQHLGVEVRTSAMVTQIEPGAVYVGQTRLPGHRDSVGRRCGCLAPRQKLDAPVDRAGRVLVQQDLSLPGHPEVFVIGDLAPLKDEDGKMLPGVAPVAMQRGRLCRQTDSSRNQGKEQIKPGCPTSRVLCEKWGCCRRPLAHFAKGWERCLPSSIPLLGQRKPGHHRPRRRCRSIRQDSHLGIHRLAGLVVRPHSISHRLPQPPTGLHSVGVVVCDLRARRTADHGQHVLAGMGCQSANTFRAVCCGAPGPGQLSQIRARELANRSSRIKVGVFFRGSAAVSAIPTP